MSTTPVAAFSRAAFARRRWNILNHSSSWRIWSLLRGDAGRRDWHWSLDPVPLIEAYLLYAALPRVDRDQ